MKNFDSITMTLNLGDLQKATKISGGRLHDMWKIETKTGGYAVKVLNPSRVSTNDLLRYRQTENISTLMAAQGVNSVSAMSFNGDVIHMQEGRYCIIYPWIEGEMLANLPVNRFACHLGRCLAQIHSVSIDYDSNYPSHTNHLNMGTDQERSWNFPNLTGELKNDLSEFHSSLIEIEEMAKQIKSKISPDLSQFVLSHRDMDSTNVIVSNNEIVIVDWELAGYINPCFDFLLTALYTARVSPGIFCLDLFKEFIKGYTAKCPIPDPSTWEYAWIKVLDGWLDWLQFSIQRTMAPTKSANEHEMGYVEARKILKTIASVFQMKSHWDLTQYIHLYPVKQ